MSTPPVVRLIGLKCPESWPKELDSASTNCNKPAPEYPYD